MQEGLAKPAGLLPPMHSRERRDVGRAMAHWLRHTSDDDRVPILTTFDFSSIRRDWEHRFLICTDQNIENAAFVAYGSRFAALLGLPETVTAIVPIKQQLPHRYQPVFSDGCSNALAEQQAVRFSGSFEQDFTVEVFRRRLLADPIAPGLVKMAGLWLVE